MRVKKGGCTRFTQCLQGRAELGRRSFQPSAGHILPDTPSMPWRFWFQHNIARLSPSRSCLHTVKSCRAVSLLQRLLVPGGCGGSVTPHSKPGEPWVIENVGDGKKYLGMG